MRTSKVYRTMPVNHYRPVVQTNDSDGQQGKKQDEQQRKLFKNTLDIKKENTEEETYNYSPKKAGLENIDSQIDVCEDVDLSSTIKKIEKINKQKKCIQTYRSSI